VTPVAFALASILALASGGQQVPPSSAPAGGIGAPKGPQLSGPELDKRTDDIGALLRCPVCQGLSVADSPATMARNMKAEVREKLAKGYDQEQILAYFERSYGEFVRLEPPMRGVNWLVWFGPVAGLLAGGAVIAWAMMRSPPEPAAAGGRQGATAAPPASDLPSRDSVPTDPKLAASVRRVRMLAYGWPQGVSPKAGS
jgi:cytochrome c-type biogenesis protein CcmH